MYDWNHNGKHDAFDDAMFMALYEDDLERHPPGKKSSYRSSSDGGSCGCLICYILLIFAPLYTALEFFLIGEGGIALGVIGLAAFFGIMLMHFSNSNGKSKSKPLSYEEIQKKKDAAKTRTEFKETIEEVPEWKQEAERIKNELRMESYRLATKERSADNNYVGIVEHPQYKVKKNGHKELLIEEYLGHQSVVTIPIEIDGMPVRVIGSNAFRNCTDVEQIIIPATVKAIENDAFCGCINLSQVVILDNVERIGKDCFYSTALTEFRFPKRLLIVESGAFANTQLVRVEFPQSVKEIKSKAFADCVQLQEVLIPKSIENIASDAFSGCDNVTIKRV